MSLIVKYEERDNAYVKVPTGMHLACCYRIIDLGTHTSEWEGRAKINRKIVIQWEIHSEDDQGNPTVTANGDPLSQHQTYTLSLGEKATLRQHLASWRGRDFTKEELRGFELKNLLGVWAMITIASRIGKNGKEYRNVVSVSPVPASLKKAGLPPIFNRLEMFNTERPDMEMFESLREYWKQQITESHEWQARQQPKQVAKASDDIADDIPF